MRQNEGNQRSSSDSSDAMPFEFMLYLELVIQQFFYLQL